MKDDGKQRLRKPCVICLIRETTGSGLCDECYRSYEVVTQKDETIAGMIQWAANRTRKFMRRPTTRPGKRMKAKKGRELPPQVTHALHVLRDYFERAVEGNDNLLITLQSHKELIDLIPMGFPDGTGVLTPLAWVKWAKGKLGYATSTQPPQPPDP